MSFFHFLRGTFSEGEQGSFGRLAFGVIIAAVIFYIVWQTTHARAIEWGNIGVFLGAAGAVTYVSNKAAATITDVMKPPPGN